MSVAKAGIIATLNARTSVLACANPVGSRYNPRISVIDNIQLPPSLMSRFDLIYLVLDKINDSTDRKLARHLIALFYKSPPENTQVTLHKEIMLHNSNSDGSLSTVQVYAEAFWHLIMQCTDHSADSSVSLLSLDRASDYEC